MGGEIAETKLHGRECESGYREVEYAICNIRRTDCEIVVVPGECRHDPRDLVPRRPDGGLPRFIPFFKCVHGGFEAIVAEKYPSTSSPEPQVCRQYRYKSAQCRPEKEWRLLVSMVADMLGGRASELRFLKGQCAHGYAAVDFQVCGVSENCSVEIIRTAGVSDWKPALPECGSGGRRQVVPVLKCDDGTFEAAVVYCCRPDRSPCEAAARDFFTLLKYGGGVCDREYDRIKRLAHTACCGSPPEYLMDAVGCEDIERVLDKVDPESDVHAALRMALFSECISSGATSCTTSGLVNEDPGYDLDAWLEVARANCEKSGGLRIESWEVREPNGVDKTTGKELYKEFSYTCCVPE